MILPNSTSASGTPNRTIGRQEASRFIVWLLINSVILFHRGIYLEGESAKYIQQAHIVLQTGRVGSSNFWLYFFQIAVLAACVKFNLSFAWVVVLQLLLNGIAAAFFYRTIQFLFDQKSLAFLGTLLLVLNYPYQEFNTFLYTESFFYSFTLLLSCYLIHIRELNPKKLLTVVLLLFLVGITRPTGLLFFPPVFLYLFLIFFRKMPILKKAALLVGLVIAFLVLLNLALGSGGELDLMLPFRDERIICGVPTLPGFLPIKTAENGNSLYGLLFYILHNTGQFLRMAGLRTMAFFGLYRFYYSTGHNCYLMIYFYSIHLLALASIGYWIKHRL